VLGLELDPELAAWGAANVAAHDLPWASLERAVPGALGRPVDGGWQRILVSAAARALPRELVAQLADDARMVVPVRSTLQLVERSNRRTRVSAHGSYSFVPLR
jgi:protein-L-isoaspartate(D-aspartate) O-methyltransferase